MEADLEYKPTSNKNRFSILTFYYLVEAARAQKSTYLSFGMFPQVLFQCQSACFKKLHVVYERDHKLVVLHSTHMNKSFKTKQN